MEQPMVQVTSASLSFGKDLVLNGLNMTVQKSVIYGLLGPSGCGKSILLNCILGRKALDSGQISLGVQNRSQIGYMPQDVALFVEFTVKEIFIFYGRMFAMSLSQIKERSRELADVLELPDWNLQIGRLSGGEQRRVSFAVALFHDPELLLLDEPTVGVDPLLSHNIWHFLLEKSRQGKTIIVTTHYVEEARLADSVGLMRGGVLLCEDSPANVMLSQRRDTLEAAFLVLSKLQRSERPACFLKKGKPSQVHPLHQNDYFNWFRFTAQLIKNLFWVKRNQMLLFFLMILPLMQAFFYCSSFGHDPQDLKILMVSEELSHEGENACSYLNAPLPAIENFTCSMSSPYSCRLLHYLKKSFDVDDDHILELDCWVGLERGVVVFFYVAWVIVHHIWPEGDAFASKALANYYFSARYDGQNRQVVSDLETAKALVYQNKAWLLLHVPFNYSTALMLRINDMTIDDDDIIDASSVFVNMDMTNYIIVNFLQKTVVDRFMEYTHELFASCGLLKSMTLTSPLTLMEPVHGSNETQFAHSGLPGFFCSFCFYFTMIFTSGAIMMEKIIGMLERSMVAGMTYLEVVTAHLAVQFVVMTAQKAIMLTVFYVVYDNPLLGSFYLIFVLLFFVEAVGISYGFLLTEIFSTDRLVSYAGVGGTLAVFSLGGIIWPLEGAHPAIKFFGWAFPVSPAIESYKNISLKGFGLFDAGVVKGYVSCFIWTAIFASITVAVVRSKKSRNIL